MPEALGGYFCGNLVIWKWAMVKLKFVHLELYKFL